MGLSIATRTPITPVIASGGSGGGTSGGGVFEIQSLLDAATGAGWTIQQASAINNLGQIAGNGVHNGQSRAFVLTPLP